MKRLLCLLMIALCCAIGCAPSDTGEPSENTSQVVTPADNVLANV